MFSKITLINFRKHTDVTFTFEDGLNVTRGLNEKGKSSVIEAVAYALFGARAMRQSLSEVVTWGKPESSLKVTLDFNLNGTPYTVTRSKSGAELYVSKTLTVTGQTEVSKFVESLLGANADTASKLMLANQASLRGALSDGPAAAVSLIETLANFDIINTYVDLIQSKLPTGSTAITEARIAQLDLQMAEPAVDTTTEPQAAVSALSLEVDQTTALAIEAQAAVVEAAPAFQEAFAARASVQKAEEDLARAQTTATRAAAAAQVTLPAEVDPSEVANLETQIAAQAKLSEAVAVKVKLDALPDGDEWKGDAASLAAALQEAEVHVTRAAESRRIAELERTKLKAKLITETHCAFCDKDLADVPEVLTRNSALAPEITKQDDILARLASEAPIQQQTVADLKAVTSRAAKAQLVYAACASYISLDTGFTPARFAWVGPDLSAGADDPTSLSRQLNSLKTRKEDRLKAAERLKQAQEQAEEAVDVLQQAQVGLKTCQTLLERLEPALEVYSQLQLAAVQAVQASGAKAAELRDAQTSLRHAQEMHSVKLKAQAETAKQSRDASELLANTNFNNALIKKLRAARPQVADKLWNVVLATVSKYFSSVRGVPSKVTRTDNGFVVDGQAIGGLSGSTLDALGLAIRIALTKTFLPNTRFLILDESSAACDEEREANMAGCVAAADFNQVIWVTHSDAIEAFANHVIQL